MAVNKNFVVKNGLEVDTDLIFADASTNKVGIGSTIPSKQLDVIGGIGASELNVTGVGTIVTLNGTTGIVTTVVAHNVQVNNLNITGITTIPKLGTLSELYVTGVSTIGTLDVIGTGNMRVGIITEAQGTNLNFAGISTITTGIVTHLVANNLNAGGISSIRSGVATHLAVNNLNVGGITSVRSGVVTHLAVNNLNVGGISTIGNVIITKSSGGIGATVGANVGVITYFGDGSNLTSVAGQGVGIGSTLGVVGYGFTFLNFVGTGSTFKVTGNTIDIGVGGGGGGSGNVSIGSEAPATPSNGDLWYSTEYGRTFIWFDEDELGIGNTAVWVDSSPFNNGGQFLSKYGDNAFGAIGYTGGTTAQASIYFTGDPNTGLIQPAADHVNIVAGGVKSLEVNPTGISVVGVITGDGSGLTGVASTDNIITTTEAKLLGGVRMEGFTTSATMNVTGVSTLRGDITLTGSQAGVTSIFFDASADTLQFQDQSYLKLGAGGDLQIYHDSENSYIKNSTGGLNLSSADGMPIFFRGGTNLAETMAEFNDNGAVKIYYDNTVKLETASDDKGGGVIVSGKIVGTAATIGTGVTINNTGIDIGIGGIGIVTAGNITGAAATITSALVGSGVTINNTGIDAGIGAGIITASTYHGDGSNLTGIAAGGGSGLFNTSISGATQYDVTTSMAVAYTANASASHRTIVHSIHICNISASEASISAEMQGSYSIAHTIPVPSGAAVELLKQPKVLGPSETIELQSDTASALEATIIVEYKEDTAFWDAQVDVTSAETLTDLYTSSSYPSVVQSILLANDNGTNDVKARVVWTDGSNNVQSYLAYDMNIPADSTVEICEQPKYLATGYKLRVYANVADRLEVTASGKQIVS